MPIQIPDPSVQTGRALLLLTPTNSPGNCGVCGYADSGRFYVSWNLDFEFYGTLYICESCVTEPCRTLGWVAPEEADRLTGIIEDLNDDVKILMDRNKKLEDSIDTLTVERFSRTITPTVLSSSQPTVSESSTAERKPAARLDSAGPTVIESDSPIVEQGRDDVRDPLDALLDGILDE